MTNWRFVNVRAAASAHGMMSVSCDSPTQRAGHAAVQVHDHRHGAEVVNVAVHLAPTAILAALDPHGLVRHVQRDVRRLLAVLVLAIEASRSGDDLAAHVDQRGHLARRLHPDQRQRRVGLIRADRHVGTPIDAAVAVEHLHVSIEVRGVPDRAQLRVGRLLARKDQRPHVLAVDARVNDDTRPAGDDEEAAHVGRDRHAELLDALLALVVAQQP